MKNKNLYIVLLILLTMFLFYKHGEALSVSATVPSPDLLVEINRYRAENKLPALKKSIIACGLAQIRAEEIKTDFSHKLFRKNINRIPVGGMFYENLAMAGYDTDKKDGSWVVPAWKASKMGHNESMLVKTTEWGCVVSSDGYYVFEAFDPSEAKVDIFY